MTENDLKQNIARNIAALRRAYNMTQAELAEKLSYSDKSISKWERGDGLPDVFVLTKIASLFGVTVNDLLARETPEPQTPAPVQKSILRSRHSLITALSVGLVWFVAALVFFFIKVFVPESPWAWMVFVYALPAASTVLVVFMHLWWKIIPQCLSVSLLVWSIAVCVHLTAVLPGVRNVTMIYVAAGVFQVLVILWYAYQYVRLKWHLTFRPGKSGADSAKAAKEQNSSTDSESVADSASADHAATATVAMSADDSKSSAPASPAPERSDKEPSRRDADKKKQ